MTSALQPGDGVARIFPHASLMRLLEAAQSRSTVRINETIRELKRAHPELYRPEALRENLS